MFRNDAQLSMVILTLLASLRLERFWTAEGPTGEACKLLEARGGYLSSGERTLFLAAFDLWNGDGKVTFDRILYGLDGPRQRMLGALLIAMSGYDAAPAIDRWIAEHQQPGGG